MQNRCAPHTFQRNGYMPTFVSCVAISWNFKMRLGPAIVPLSFEYLALSQVYTFFWCHLHSILFMWFVYSLPHVLLFSWVDGMHILPIFFIT